MEKTHPNRQLTVREFFKLYPDDDTCLEHVMEARFGLTHTCAKCGVIDATFHRLQNRKAYACAHCGDNLYPCAGSIFQDSRTPLQIWFYAIYLFSVSRNGVSGMELHRALGVTRKCAMRIARQIRILMGKADDAASRLLTGTVESDEAFVGGVNLGGGQGYGRDNKTIILGLKERGGRIIAKVIPNTKGETIRAEFHKHVERNAIIHTDEANHYGLVERDEWEHHTVNHSKKEYARPDHLRGGKTIHVNGVENFWGHFKASIRGTHVHISQTHAQKYVNEFTFRANNRQIGNQMFGALLAAL